MAVELGDPTPTRVDRTSFALVPGGYRYRVNVLVPMTRLATLPLEPSARGRARAEYQGYIDEARFNDLLGVPRILPRTRWVDEVVQRYVFERVVCEKHGSMAAVFLETEIAKEVFFLAKEREEERTRPTVVEEEGDVARRARAWVDANLFEPLRVGDLARHCHTSESTLLRVFRRQFQTTPATYARERRLEASLLLLKSGRYTVTEVATRVGYGSLPAFTIAFRRRFGSSPSTARTADNTLERLPPHGSPPHRAR
ncbi:MAG: helix-turn-helix transcriptional regulator [Polyangiaceae bacterium]